MAGPGTARQKEGLPFLFALIAMGVGTLWNAAGGSIEAFGHLGSVVVRDSGDVIGNPTLFFEKLIRIPTPIKIPPQLLIPPEEIARGKKFVEKLPEPRPALAALGGEGKRNTFFPEWAREIVQEIEPPSVDVEAAGPKSPGGKGDAAKGGPRVEEDQYIFHGVVKIKDDPPFAIVRDVNKQASVFLKEGERYGPIQALKVGLGSATFVIQGKEQQTFDTLHGSNKTIVVRRYTGGS